MKERGGGVFNNNEIELNGKDLELPLFSFSVILAITKNFSELNMLGKGGFGHVYKVCLHFIYRSLIFKSHITYFERENMNFCRPTSPLPLKGAFLGNG